MELKISIHNSSKSNETKQLYYLLPPHCSEVIKLSAKFAANNYL